MWLQIGIYIKSKHKLMTRYFHNYVLIYRTVLPAHENALIVQSVFYQVSDFI